MYQRKLPTDRGALQELVDQRLAAMEIEGQVPPLASLAPLECELLRQRTELELQIAELQRANDLLTAALNGTPDAMFVKDREGRYLLLNEAAASFIGRPCADVLGLDESQLFAAEGAAQVLASDQQILSAGETVCAESVLTAQGVQRTFWTSKAPLRDEAGRIVGIVGAARDISTLKEAESRRQESNEARLAEAQEIGGVGSFEMDVATWRGRCSPALCKIFGFPNDEPFRDVLAFFRKYRHPDDHERSDESRRRLVESGTADEVEHRYLHPDGQERILHVRRRVIRDSAGVAVKLVGTVQDVTERRRAEEELRASESRYRLFVDHVTDALFLHGPDSSVRDVNQQACDSLGYAREELIGKMPFEFDPDLTRAQLEGIVAQRRDSQLISVESRHRRRDGSTFPVEVRIRPFVWNGEDYSIALVQDITQRRVNEQALRESERRFRELADAIPQIVWLAGPDGGLIHLNARAVEYTGLQLSGLTGWSWEQVIHPDDMPNTIRDWTAILQTGNPQLLEFRIRRADGEYRWHITRQVASRDSAGNITQWYGTCTDIEDHKRAQEALRASEDRYRRLFNSIPEPMFVYDPQTYQYLAVNDAAIEKYGYSRDEFLRMTLMDIRPPEDVPALLDMLARSQPVFENRGLWRHRKKNGEAISVEITVHTLELDGRPAVIGLARDVTVRMQIENEARRTAELLRVVAEGTPDAVFVKDRQGRYLLFNPAAARFVGKPVEEVLGKDDTSLFGPEDAAVIMAVDRRVMETQVAETNEERLTAAGVTRWYLAMKAPYHDGNGQVLGTLGISRDITERKQAEVQIRESQQRLQALFNNALNAILLASDEGNYVDANPAACAMLGYSREELLRIPMREIVVLEADALDEVAMWQQFRREGQQRGLIHLRRKDGQEIFAEFSAVANVLPGVHLSVMSDVTERKHAEEAFRKVSTIHETIIHTAGEGICLCSPTGDEKALEFTVWNDQMTALTGYTREEVNEHGVIELVFPDAKVREQVRGQLADLIAGKAMQGEEWEVTRKDGERRLLSISTSAIALESQSLSFVSMIQDITQRRRDAEELALRQAELRHVSRLTTVGQMVAALSHEVAQPLAAISNFAASSAALLNAKDACPLDVVRQHIDQITQQSRRAAAIIHRLRDYSRKGSPQQVTCDLHELLRSSVEMLSLEFRRGEVQVDFAFTAETVVVSADPVQLQQVFVNLLLNARDALLEITGHPRIVVLRTVVETKFVVVEIEDNGPGVGEEVASRLFEPFVTTKDQGVGIGLSICRSILRDHGGEIEYHPVQQGGTKFRVRLALNPSRQTTT